MPAGDVFGPRGASDNSIPRFSGTTGKIIGRSTVLIQGTGSNEMIEVKGLNCELVTQGPFYTKIRCIPIACKTVELNFYVYDSVPIASSDVVMNNITSTTGYDHNVFIGTSTASAIQTNSVSNSYNFALTGEGPIINSYTSDTVSFNGTIGGFLTPNKIIALGNGGTTTNSIHGSYAIGAGCEIYASAGSSNITRNVVIIGTSQTVTDGDHCFFYGNSNLNSGGLRSNCHILGTNCEANVNGCMLLGDGNATVLTGGTNALSGRFSGGYYLYSDGAVSVGLALLSNATAWSTLSDAAYKHDKEPVDILDIYKKHQQLNIFTYKYLEDLDPEGTKRLGTDANVFNKQFGNEYLFPTVIDKDGRQLISSGDIDYVRMAALKQAQLYLDTMEDKSLSLERQMNTLLSVLG